MGNRNERLVLDIADFVWKFHNWGIDHLSGTGEYEKYMDIVNGLAGLADSVGDGKYDND